MKWHIRIVKIGIRLIWGGSGRSLGANRGLLEWS